jgi:DNA-binding transcriptional LysR family regulator
MRIEQLYFFVEVSRCRSISLAASHLFMTQQNISTGIKKLEEELGLTLFERTHQGVALTPQGEEVLVQVKEIVEKIDRLKAIGCHPEEQLTGELRVDFVPYIALPDVILEFIKENPRVNIKTTERSPADIVANIVNGLADVGFIYLRDEESLDNYPFELEKLARDQLYICVSKKLNYTKRNYSIDELIKKKMPLVVFNNLYDWTMETFAKNLKEKPLVFRVDTQLYKRMIREGMAAGFATKTGIDQEIVFSKGEVDTFKIADEFLTVCMLHKKTPSSPLKESFLAMIQERFQAMNAEEVTWKHY